MQTPQRYLLTMEDFLKYIRQQRVTLKKELAALDTAEKIFRDSQSHGATPELPPMSTGLFYEPKTIKQMVVRVLEESSRKGQTSSQILWGIQQRWMPELQRSSLAPQLTRLKRDNVIYNHQRLWKLVQNDAPSAETGEASNSAGVAG